MEHIIIMAAIFITQRGKLKCCTAVFQGFRQIILISLLSRTEKIRDSENAGHRAIF